MENCAEVELAGVTKHYAGTAAVDSVSLSIEPGEFLTLLGPSGCGKTTLLRLIGGFIRPDEGSILLAGKDVTSLPPYKRNVTTVFQQYALFPHLNVFENVAFGLRVQGLPGADIKRQVSESLDIVRLSGMESRRPSEISGGQQQRVALARALVVKPRVLLLDEPLAALDLKLRQQMQIELKSLQRRLNISFVYVTHDQQEALTMSDRISVMNRGRIQQTAPAREIYESPANEFVADFIGLSNILHATLAEVQDSVCVVDIAGCRLGARRNSSHGQLRKGDAARLMVRPEKVRIASPEGAGLRGAIRTGVYLGDTTRWIVDLDCGVEISVIEQNNLPGAPDRKAGANVSVTWEPETAVLL